jgi:hypothetical protein
MVKTMHGATPSTVRPYGRLKLVGAGLVLALVGSLRMAKGVQVVTHSTGQPMFSWGLLAAGGLCILLALIPTSWIAKAAITRSKTHRRGQ